MQRQPLGLEQAAVAGRLRRRPCPLQLGAIGRSHPASTKGSARSSRRPSISPGNLPNLLDPRTASKWKAAGAGGAAGQQSRSTPAGAVAQGALAGRRISGQSNASGVHFRSGEARSSEGRQRISGEAERSGVICVDTSMRQAQGQGAGHSGEAPARGEGRRRISGQSSASVQFRTG